MGAVPAGGDDYEELTVDDTESGGFCRTTDGAKPPENTRTIWDLSQHLCLIHCEERSDCTGFETRILGSVQK